MAHVRHIVNDVDAAVDFDVSKLGFELEQQFGPAIAILVHGDLTLWVAGPTASASRPMLDGAIPSPGEAGPGSSGLSTFWYRSSQSRWCGIYERHRRSRGSQTDSLPRPLWKRS